MHIALLSPGWPLGFPNGITTYCHHLRNGLIELGHEVTILTFSHHAGNSSDAKGRIFVLDKETSIQRMLRGGKHKLGIQALSEGASVILDGLRKINSISPLDVLEMEESFGWAGEVAKYAPCKVVTKLHGPAFLTQALDGNFADASLATRIEREGISLRSTTHVTSPASNTLERTISHYRIDRKNTSMSVIRNPVEIVPLNKVWNRDGCRSPRDTCVIGRFDTLKGIDLVISAIGRLNKASSEPYRLHFVGPNQGSINIDGRRMNLVEFLTETVRPRDSDKIIVYGPKPQDFIKDLRMQCGLTIIPSRWENQAGTILEAMSQGCPILVSDAGGNPELIADNDTGRLFQSNNYISLAEKIREILEDPQPSWQWGARARSFVEDQHSPAHIAQQTLAFYRTAHVTATR